MFLNGALIAIWVIVIIAIILKSVVEAVYEGEKENKSPKLLKFSSQKEKAYSEVDIKELVYLKSELTYSLKYVSLGGYADLTINKEQAEILLKLIDTQLDKEYGNEKDN